MTLNEMEHEYYDLAMDAARSTDTHIQRIGLKHLSKIIQHQKETNAETDLQFEASLTKEQRAILNRSTFHIIGEKQ